MNFLCHMETPISIVLSDVSLQCRFCVDVFTILRVRNPKKPCLGWQFLYIGKMKEFTFPQGFIESGGAVEEQNNLLRCSSVVHLCPKDLDAG